MKQICGKVYLIFLVLFSKFIYIFIRLFNLGSGYTLPGYLILKLFPSIFNYLDKKFPKGVIVVTGTNGKTTTSKLVSYTLQESGFKVLHNHSGSNLLRGILSVLLLCYFENYDYAVFEVDEFSLSLVLKHVKPTHLIFLNLSRDQLDRYGEIDIILKKWISSVKNLDSCANVLIDSEASEFKKIPEIYKNVIYFQKRYDLLETAFLEGGFNAQNIGASLEVVKTLNISEDKFIKILKSFGSAYGRGEKIKLNEYVFNIYLAKNPESFNQNLKMLNQSGNKFDAFLFILNDNLPDGRDVSWIYDIDPLLLEKVCAGKKILVSGRRYLDMAVRLKYAGIKAEKLDRNVSKLISFIKKENSKNICVLPNYSAMLKVRKILTGKAIL